MKDMKGYGFLSVSIIAEIIATVCLKLSEGFTILLPSIIVAIGYGIAFFMLSLSLKYLALSLAYAIWSGVGTALTAILGILIFSEPLSLGIVLGVTCIILGVIFMNTSTSTDNKTATE